MEDERATSSTALALLDQDCVRSGVANRALAMIVAETSCDADCRVASPGAQATANLVWIYRGRAAWATMHRRSVSTLCGVRSGSRIHLLLVAPSSPSCSRVDADSTQVCVVPDGLVTVPELHVKLEATELAHLLIKQSAQHRVFGAIDGDTRKHMIPSVSEGLEAFLLGSVREAIDRRLHKINELECGVTRDVRAKKIVQQP